MRIRGGAIAWFIAGIFLGLIASVPLLHQSWIHNDFWDFSFFQLLQLLMVGGIGGVWVAHKLNALSTNTNRLRSLVETLIEEYEARLLAIESQAKVYRDNPCEGNRHTVTAAARSASQALGGLRSGMDHCKGSLAFNHSTEQLTDLFLELHLIATDELFENQDNLRNFFNRLESKIQQLRNVLRRLRFGLYLPRNHRSIDSE